jgi:riboflavin kinase/FMN adenylyltransferase
MKIIYQSEIIDNAPCVATVGFFDGVHSGHRFLLEQLKTFASEKKIENAVITFAIHPRKVLHSDFQPLLLTTLDEKLAQLSGCGIDKCYVLIFDEKMASLSAAEFLNEILYKRCGVRFLLVGHDHRFGHNRTDGFPAYKIYGNAIGMEVFQASRFETQSDSHISSSEIRHALSNGEISKANRLLSYRYSFTGKVVEGFQVGRQIAFPTANIRPDFTDKLIPGNGVYAVGIIVGDKWYKGMMNIGFRPTVANGNNLSLEVHILDFDQNIYGETVTVQFYDKIREEIKFNDIKKLTEQLKKDKETVSIMQFDQKKTVQ